MVLVVADDMGYSDLECYGGEIPTPNLSRLGRQGLRLSNFYTAARCSPSRASLLTGMHPHQVGMGILTNNDAPRGYPGTLAKHHPTTAEIFRDAGYSTCLAGKWHLASDMASPNSGWPTRRGFDRFFGTLAGCGSYYAPGTLTRGEWDASDEANAPDFFYTDAITAEAVSFLEEEARKPTQDPFFLYVAYTAPHWPLHAMEKDVNAMTGIFDAGWDELRDRRMARLIEEGLLSSATELSERDPTQPSWADTADKGWQIRRMQTYAAQIRRMDEGVGRIHSALERTGRLDNTIIVFLSDNGASSEQLPKVELDRFRLRTDILPERTRDGRAISVGNEPHIVPGPEDTYASYGPAWANLSNTPFRFYKRWVHEGGVACPLIVHWPAGGLANGTVVHLPTQLVDILPTLLEATSVRYPGMDRAASSTTLEGQSILPALRGAAQDSKPLYWEHTGNAAIRLDDWKLVREYPGKWELYNLAKDRTELHDLAAVYPRLVEQLAQSWRTWAERVEVIPWEDTLELYRARGLDDEDAAG